jgi:hypothetical protein
MVGLAQFVGLLKVYNIKAVDIALFQFKIVL